jgi:hypothetical protein
MNVGIANDLIVVFSDLFKTIMVDFSWDKNDLVALKRVFIHFFWYLDYNFSIFHFYKRKGWIHLLDSSEIYLEVAF